LGDVTIRRHWVILAQYHQPTEQYGTLMSLADVIGFHNVRTSMPEYIRIIERGTGKERQWLIIRIGSAKNKN
jgi:hypothetical protein